MRRRRSAGSITAVICKFIVLSMGAGRSESLLFTMRVGRAQGRQNSRNRLASLSFRSDATRPVSGTGSLLFMTGGQPSPSVRPSWSDWCPWLRFEPWSLFDPPRIARSANAVFRDLRPGAAARPLPTTRYRAFSCDVDVEQRGQDDARDNDSHGDEGQCETIGCRR